MTESIDGSGASRPSGAAAARRIAAGPPLSKLVSGTQGDGAHDGDLPPSPVTDTTSATDAASLSDTASETTAPFDPLRLCIFATIALLGWLAGPWALVLFAGVGFTGYWKARRAGLARSKCYLRDTRLVLAYLATLTVAGLWGIYSQLA